jgi:uncharacterized protein YggE
MDTKIPKFPPLKNKKKLSVTLDSRTFIIILLLIIVGMLFAWKPWNKSPQNTDRTVQVNGAATVKAEPDEFDFSPSYDFKNQNKQVALDELSKKSNEITAQLKKLGVDSGQIKTNADGYRRGIYLPASDDSQTTYTLMVNIVVDSKEVAQKVQDYLTTTAPEGSVTPYPSFSENKKNELESQARHLAEQDARSKAEKTTKNLGFKLGAVKSISDTNGYGGVEPLLEKGANSSSLSEPTAGLGIAVQPGQNDINYQISVTYYIK